MKCSGSGSGCDWLWLWLCLLLLLLALLLLLLLLLLLCCSWCLAASHGSCVFAIYVGVVLCEHKQGIWEYCHVIGNWYRQFFCPFSYKVERNMGRAFPGKKLLFCASDTDVPKRCDWFPPKGTN